MKYALSLIISTAALLPFTVQAADDACPSTSENDIAALFTQWNEDLRSGDPKRVVQRYATDSLLLPTLSNTPRETAEGKEDYFSHFMAKRPDGRIDSRMIRIDCRTALDTGLYTFHFGDGSAVQARYTFTYRWDPQQARWLISSHHSSAMPERAATTP